MTKKHPLSWQWWKWPLLTAYYLIYAGIFMALAGDWRWPEGWILSGYMIFTGFFLVIYLYIKDPALLKERMKRPGADNTESWDKYLLILFGLLFMGWFFIIPLDAIRFEWTAPFPLWINAVGGLSLLFAFYLLFMSFVENAYLSPNVRHQKERGHQLVDTGVYGIVRHPMYLAAFFWMIGGSLLTSSAYSLMVALFAIFILMIRIIGEENMLARELKGYKAYRKKVKWRLLPLIW